MTLKETILNSVATAVLLAAGSTVAGVKLNDSRQDDRIEQLEALQGSVEGLRSDLARVDKRMEHLDGQLEGERNGQGH